MPRHSFHTVFLCGALGLGLAGVPTASAADVQAEQSQPALRVTYLLYSGRPNPVVLVTDPARLRAIEEQLERALTSGERVTKAESHAVLGYTGIQVERLGPSARNSAPLVLRGDLLRTSSSQGTVSRDVAGIENLLLQLGREQKVIGDVELSVIRQTR
ncbi:hypothetical protein D7X74_27895 [Corallococcus sp. CA047B]|uniref:hypothetical protein n=1 Tax=Corallococcus sp. CA047B TaxID=2316729 RepID=UPI000EA1A292|nr:hypothetical protein [Corallococcus sp. CA047B]RKH10221.1 hypothetical protein D7X74_27895 [Corallococcus sp. CA047B]